MTEQPLTGLYFALSKRASSTPFGGGSADARFHDGRIGHDEESPILRHDLLLEALLTAPHGQLSHFEHGADGPVPSYINSTVCISHQASIEEVHRGMEAFIHDVGRVVGENIIELTFSPDMVQRPLECLGNGLWKPPIILGELVAEDNHSGRGDVRVTVKN